MNPIEEFDSTIEKLKDIDILGFKGYRIDKLLTISTHEVVKGSFKLNLFSFFRSLLRIILKDEYCYSFDSIKNANLVLFYSHSHALRKDYVYFMETVAKSSENAVLFSGNLSKKGLFSNIRVSSSCITMLLLVFSWLVSFCKIGINKKFWLKYLISLLEGYKWKCLLEKNKNAVLSIKSMVSIFDAREFENVLTQYLSHHGIPTGTLQHGHYGKDYYKDPQHYFIEIGYRGFVSDYFLLWGEYYYKNAISCGIEEYKLRKVGCPYLINPKKLDGKKGAIGLLLDGGIDAIADNKNMYNIVREFAKDMKIVVKLHPSYKTSEYTFFKGEKNVEEYTGDLESFAADVEIAVCCNTSCLITLLIWGHPLLHYAPIFIDDLYSELKKNSFSNIDELNDLYKESITPTDLLSLYTEVGDVKTNYRKTFEEILISDKT